MLTRQSRDFLVPPKRQTNPMHFVRRHRFAIARSAKNDPALAFAARDRFGRRPNEERIIDRLFTERPAIFHFVTERAEQLLHLLFVTETCVIGAERNFHESVIPSGVEESLNISVDLLDDSKRNSKRCLGFARHDKRLAAVQFRQLTPDLALTLG